MNNLGLIDKLVFITDLAKDKTMDTGDVDKESLVSEYEEELIEFLQQPEKDNKVYVLTYNQDQYRTKEYGDKYYFQSKDNMINKLKYLLLEDGYIDNVEQHIAINLEILGQYEVNKGIDKIYFTTDILDINN